MNILIILLVFVPIIISFFLYRIKDSNTMWKITLSTIVVALLASLYLLLNYTETSVNLPLFSSFGIVFETNPLGIFYVFLACILFLVSVITSKEYFSQSPDNLNRYYCSVLLVFSGIIGIFLGADLFTIFIFFEIMSFASYAWVAHNQNKESVIASELYLAFTVLGGLSLLFGIFILNAYEQNSIVILANGSEFDMHVFASVMMFLGFGAKAGAFFLHDWLPLAYVASPAPASGLLSSLLSKAGIYGIIIIVIKIIPYSQTFTYFILVISILNMLFGAICALRSANLKRTLAFSSISQIGFILWGIALCNLLGEHGTYAAYGTVFHMINHSLIKILLFSLAGVIYKNKHSLHYEDIKGYGRNKPWLRIVFILGFVSVAGLPLFSGYISKTLLHESIVEYMHLNDVSGIFLVCEYLFLIAGGLTFAYMLKLFVCLFIKFPNNDLETSQYVTPKTKITLSIVAACLVILGVFPNQTFGIIGSFTAEFFGAHSTDHISYFTFSNLKGSAISICIGIIIYYVTKHFLDDKSAYDGYIEHIKLVFTFDRIIYRPVIAVLTFISAFIFRVLDISLDLIIFIVNKLIFRTEKIPQEFFQGSTILHKRPEIHFSYSLAYSLLMFGLGFILTIVYLLFVGM